MERPTFSQSLLFIPTGPTAPVLPPESRRLPKHPLISFGLAAEEEERQQTALPGSDEQTGLTELCNDPEVCLPQIYRCLNQTAVHTLYVSRVYAAISASVSTLSGITINHSSQAKTGLKRNLRNLSPWRKKETGPSFSPLSWPSGANGAQTAIATVCC